jgi:hypothetical protein
VLILNVVKALCFDTLLEVLILKGLILHQNCAKYGPTLFFVSVPVRETSTPIGRFIPPNARDGAEMAFPAGRNKKGGGEAAAVGNTLHSYPGSRVPNKV